MHLSLFERWWMGFWPHRLHVRFHVPRFLRSCPDPFRGEVLEVGAGHGFTTRRILETFPQVELSAVDVDAAVVSYLGELTTRYGRRLHVKQANALKLPFDRESFDIVLVINMLRYLSPAEAVKALHEFLRVTRPGGLIGISQDRAWYQLDREAKAQVEAAIADEESVVEYRAAKSGLDLWIRKAFRVPPRKV